jgi:hypothetical protein
MKKVRKIAMPVQFEDRTIQYVVEDAISEDIKKGKGGTVLAGSTNPETWKFMKEGYVILRDFIPKDIITMAMDTWLRMELDPQMSEHLELEHLIIDHKAPEDSFYKSNGMWCSPMGVALHRWLWEALKDVIDLNLQETYSYTRKYDRGAYLKAHADRPSCEISATICLDYKTDDNKPWPIWVDNSRDWINTPNEIFEKTQAIPIRKRKTAKRIDLEVGDVLLYQGPNVAHWREYLLGEESYHMFLHFYNKTTNMGQMPGMDTVFDAQPDYIKIQNDPVFPCRYDGRASRYHTQDIDSWEFKSHEKLMSDVWDNKETWAVHQKSDFVNRYQDFKQIVDGKVVENDPNIFETQYPDSEIVKTPRQTPA